MLKNAVKLSVLYMTRKLQSSTPDSKIQFAQFLLNYRKCFVNYPIVLKNCINTVFVHPSIAKSCDMNSCFKSEITELHRQWVWHSRFYISLINRWYIYKLCHASFCIHLHNVSIPSLDHCQWV